MAKRLIDIDAICGAPGKGDGKFPIARSRLYELMNNGLFPLPLKIGRRNLWVEDEIDQFITDLAARRDAAAEDAKRAPLIPTMKRRDLVEPADRRGPGRPRALTAAETSEVKAGAGSG